MTVSIVFIALIFCYFRLKPIYFQTVAYTYDQGRDFLKAAEIVLYKNPTFIGPTTGIIGLYHGAWWYYLLTVPFILFRGSPVGFYFFNFLLYFLGSAALLFFFKRYFGLLAATILLFLIAISPYAIYNAVFVGNNNTTPLVLIGLLVTNFYILETDSKSKKKEIILFFLNGIFLGLVAEFEFSFGLMIIPAYILLSVGLPFLRKKFINLNHIIFFLTGLGLAFSLRLLFELKNNFAQTKILLAFFLKPKLHNPKPYFDIVKDRLMLFWTYYSNLFPSKLLLWIVTICVIMLLIAGIKNRTLLYTRMMIFISSLLLLLFLLSTFYSDNFWFNYYEGLPYMFIFLFGIILASLVLKANWQTYSKIILLAVMCFLTIYGLFIDVGSTYAYDGIKVQQDIVDYVVSQEKNLNNYCVRVYTPPVFPYTYDYLFLHKNLTQKIALPQKEWQNNNCWFIIEHDDYKERRAKWLNENLPKKGKKISSKKIKDVMIEYWTTE